MTCFRKENKSLLRRNVKVIEILLRIFLISAKEVEIETKKGKNKTPTKLDPVMNSLSKLHMKFI